LRTYCYYTFQLNKLVKENRDHMKDENIGTTRSAAVFIKLLNVARESKMEDIYTVLKSPKNKDILYVLFILGMIIKENVCVQ